MPDLGVSAFKSLSQAIEAFRVRSTIAATQPTSRVFVNSDMLDFETQSEYGGLIWGRLCTDTRRAVKNGLAPGKRLSLAASWIRTVSILNYESIQVLANQ